MRIIALVLTLLICIICTINRYNLFGVILLNKTGNWALLHRYDNKEFF